MVTADAIVHPTNESYSTAGQVGRVLQAAGSLEYQAALDSIKSLGNMDKCGGLWFLDSLLKLVQTVRLGCRWQQLCRQHDS